MRKTIALLALVVMIYIALRGGLGLADNTLTLKAKPWNNGQVHIWNNLREDASTSPTNLPEGTVCTRLDDKLYKIGNADTAIYYYLVGCDGVIGYVEIDQAH